MRRIVVRSSLAVLAPALLAFNAGVAAADSAPAPDCESYSSQFACEAASPVSPVTWTMTLSILGTSSTSTFSGRRSCTAAARSAPPTRSPSATSRAA